MTANAEQIARDFWACFDNGMTDRRNELAKLLTTYGNARIEEAARVVQHYPRAVENRSALLERVRALAIKEPTDE